MTAQGAPPPSAEEQLRLPLERHGEAEAFVVSDSNADAVGVLARWPDGVGSALSLYGPPGSGKSDENNFPNAGPSVSVPVTPVDEASVEVPPTPAATSVPTVH